MNRAVALVTLLALLTALLRISQAINCGQVDATIAPCIGYLQGGGNSPPGWCCDAVQNLVNLTPSKQDRQIACECLKTAASNVPNIKADVAADLPGKCGVTASISINPNINCQSIN